MINSPVILGGYQTDFDRNVTKEGLDLFALIHEASHGALEDANMEASEIQVGHVGNMAGELFSGQAHLGGMLNAADPAWAMLPTSRHEAACASGSIAILSAMSDLAAGNYDVALVLGVELMRNVPAAQGAAHLGAAAWVGPETEIPGLPWPTMFDKVADIYDELWGLDYAHLAEIARINFGNAQNNPRSQTRTWDFPEGSFSEDDALNPLVQGRLRRYDCGRITDGATAVVLASPQYADEYARHRCLDGAALPRVLGWGHRSAPLSLDQKVASKSSDRVLFPHLQTAISDAFGRAGLAGVEDVDLIETHDCFTISEYVALDHFGLTAPGRAGEAIDAGRITMDGDIPVNPSGGLLGNGHPVGATGVRMLVDASRQVTGTAEGYQVDGARRASTLNFGGSFTTAVSLVVGAE